MSPVNGLIKTVRTKRMRAEMRAGEENQTVNVICIVCKHMTFKKSRKSQRHAFHISELGFLRY